MHKATRKLLKLLIFICFSTSSFAQVTSAQLKNGDILFVANTHSELGNAIDAVTQTNQQTHYFHMGLIAKTDSAISILHADSENGVEEQSLKNFRYISKDLYVYRLKNYNDSTTQKAIEFARKHIGAPYNYSYIMPDSGFYCSEYVYAAFEPFETFELNPMTFKNPTGEINSTWIEHYRKLGMEVPEGEPGCNPNGMATSDKIVFIGKLTP